MFNRPALLRRFVCVSSTLLCVLSNQVFSFQQPNNRRETRQTREESLRKASARALNSLGAHYYEAQNYRQADRPEKAQEHLSKLQDDRMTRAQYHVILADVHRSQTKVSEAIAEYEKALSLAGNLPEVNYQLGVLRYQEGIVRLNNLPGQGLGPDRA